MYIQDSKLLAPWIVCFAELVETGLWAVWAKQHATSTLNPSIYIQTIQEEIDCTKAKK